MHAIANFNDNLAFSVVWWLALFKQITTKSGKMANFEIIETPHIQYRMLRFWALLLLKKMDIDMRVRPAHWIWLILSTLSFLNGLFQPWLWILLRLQIGFESKLNNILANSVDPNDTDHYEQSRLDLHCLQRYLYWSAGVTGLMLSYMYYAELVDCHWKR